MLKEKEFLMASILYVYMCGTKIKMPLLSPLLGANRTVLHIIFFPLPNSSTCLLGIDSCKEIAHQNNQLP